MELADHAATRYTSKNYSTQQICEQLKIGSKATLYNYLRHEGIEIEGCIIIPTEDLLCSFRPLRL